MFDDVFTIELRAIAGFTIPLVDKSFTPDAAASKVSDNITPAADRYISTFPLFGYAQGWVHDTHKLVSPYARARALEHGNGVAGTAVLRSQWPWETEGITKWPRQQSAEHRREISSWI